MIFKLSIKKLHTQKKKKKNPKRESKKARRNIFSLHSIFAYLNRQRQGHGSQDARTI